MSYILQSGLLTFGTYKGGGRLLMNETHIFALSDDPTAAMTLGMLGGVVGALIGKLIDRFSRSALLPAHLNDPDLATIPEAVKKALAGTVLLVKIPVDGNLIIRSTFAGFDFASPQHGLLKWRGLIYKAKVKRMLNQLNLSITG